MNTPDIQDYLREQHVPFETMPHPHAFTARETADSAHLQGSEVAKTVMVRLDGKLAMAVVPANEWLELATLGKLTGAHDVALAGETEFKDRFPGCEVGAMPPFGNLYGMEVFVADTLSGGRIAFNAGNHRQLLRMAWDDFERLVKPKIGHQLTRH